MEKPIPKPSFETQPYWDGAAKGQLRYTRCMNCSDAFFPPRARCPLCGGATSWCTSEGRGIIHTITEVFRAPTDAFRADVPYFIALVDLAEGFRIMVNVRGGRTAAIGDQVSTIFESAASGISLPQACVTEPQ
jgi:uncharacterized OB-fold protein